MLVVGLTGNIGSGKSTVTRLLAARAPVIDADVLARDAVARGTPALEAIAARWGSRVLAPDGTLDRAALRRIVFANPAERAALDAIVHPAVKARRDALVAEHRSAGAKVVICDIPLLFEANLTSEVGFILLVDAPREVRLDRIVRDRGLSRADAEAMINAQMPPESKRARADYVIENDSTLDVLATRVNDAWRFIGTRATT